MAHITRERLETCLAFGEASLAVAHVVELLRLQVGMSTQVGPTVII